jgi:hypothetical protein
MDQQDTDYGGLLMCQLTEEHAIEQHITKLNLALQSLHRSHAPKTQHAAQENQQVSQV